MSTGSAEETRCAKKSEARAGDVEGKNTCHHTAEDRERVEHTSPMRVEKERGRTNGTAVRVAAVAIEYM